MLSFQNMCRLSVPHANSADDARTQRWGVEAVGPKPPEKSKKYRVSWQYWSGSHKIHNATKPAFNVGPSSARQQNTI